MRLRAADLNSIPIGVPQMAGAPENFYIRLENSGYNRYREYIPQLSGVQEKICRIGNIEILTIALLPAEGLDDGLLGLFCCGTVGIILIQPGVNGFGLFDFVRAARGEYLAGEDFGDVIIAQLQVL